MNRIMTPPISFGIVDQRTKQLYPDIITFALVVLPLSPIKAEEGSFLSHRGIPYEVMMDSRLRKALDKGSQTAIVSFQHRESGYYAVCRLYQEKRLSTGTAQILREESEETK